MRSEAKPAGGPPGSQLEGATTMLKALMHKLTGNGKAMNRFALSQGYPPDQGIVWDGAKRKAEYRNGYGHTSGTIEPLSPDYDRPGFAAEFYGRLLGLKTCTDP